MTDETAHSEDENETGTTRRHRTRSAGAESHAADSHKTEAHSFLANGGAWTPPSYLPEPEPEPGVVFRWLRRSTNGRADPVNMSRQQRTGWELCKAEDYPEVAAMCDIGTEGSGNIEIGGLVLAKMPAKLSEAIRDHYAQQHRRTREAVDQNFMAENDKRAPLFHERAEKTSYSR